MGTLVDHFTLWKAVSYVYPFLLTCSPPQENKLLSLEGVLVSFIPQALILLPYVSSSLTLSFPSPPQPYGILLLILYLPYLPLLLCTVFYGLA